MGKQSYGLLIISVVNELSRGWRLLASWLVLIVSVSCNWLVEVDGC